jgi:hypothetical protein
MMIANGIDAIERNSATTVRMTLHRCQPIQRVISSSFICAAPEENALQPTTHHDASALSAASSDNLVTGEHSSRKAEILPMPGLHRNSNSTRKLESTSLVGSWNACEYEIYIMGRMPRIIIK